MPFKTGSHGCNVLIMVSNNNRFPTPLTLEEFFFRISYHVELGRRNSEVKPGRRNSKVEQGEGTMRWNQGTREKDSKVEPGNQEEGTVRWNQGEGTVRWNREKEQ